MRDLMKEFCGIVALVGKKQGEMRGNVAESPYAKHSSYIDQAAVAKDVPERRHRQRQPKKHERPKTRAMNQFVERTRAVRDFARLDNSFDERHQQKGECRNAERGQISAPIAPNLPACSPHAVVSPRFCVCPPPNIRHSQFTRWISLSC